MYQYKFILDQLSSLKFNDESGLFDVLKTLSEFSSVYGSSLFDGSVNEEALKLALKDGWHHRYSVYEYNGKDFENGYFKTGYPSFFMEEKFWNKSIVPVIQKIQENINYFNQEEVEEYFDNLFKFIYFSTTCDGVNSFNYVILKHRNGSQQFKSNPSFLEYFKDVLTAMEFAYHKYNDLMFSKISSYQYFIEKLENHYSNCYYYPQINPKTSLILIGIE